MRADLVRAQVDVPAEWDQHAVYVWRKRTEDCRRSGTVSEALRIVVDRSNQRAADDNV
jgi:hypothetical protein